MNEPGLDRRSLTPCLDENDENCAENSKEIELSDISDIDDGNWSECNKNNNDERRDGAKANGNEPKESNFKKINRSTRGRNYRDNIRRKSESGNFQHRQQIHQPYRRFEAKRRDIERYSVRNVVASREFSISRSRSRSPRIRRSRSFSPKPRDSYRRKSNSPAHYRYKSPPRKYSPFSSKHSRSPSLDQSYRYRRSLSPELPSRRSRSRQRNRSTERLTKRKKHRSKDRSRKHKKSRSQSKLQISSSPSISPEPARSVTSQVLSAPNQHQQENIKIILKNEEAIAKRQKLKKREKKSRKLDKDGPQSKEVFASGDNILISVCFNNNNNNNNGDALKEQIRTKPKKQRSPVTSVSSDTSERRPRKHKRKKVKNKREKAPETPPIAQSKRKSDMKPIAIIDLEKSPGKEVTQSPKEVIVLSDSDGEGKKPKDVIIIEDVILEKTNRNQPESPPSAPQPTLKNASQPTLKFALKTKSNILPFNLLHDQAEEVDEAVEGAETDKNQQKDPENEENAKNANQREAYDPFEPTKSGSTSPVTPPPNDVSSSSDMMKKLESPAEKILEPPPPVTVEEHLISSSIWSRKEKQPQPTTPPLPPTFNIFSGSSTQTKPHNLYDGIYSNDLKTPAPPTPVTKAALKATIEEVKKNDDDRTPYSPSSDGYDFEPPPAANNDTGPGDPGSGSSYTFSSNDDLQQTKITPLKLTASTLKTFNNSMRSTGPVGLQFVNKTELSIFENYLPASQKSPLVKRQSRFLSSKISRFQNSLNENGSPAMPRSLNYHEMKPPVIDDTMLDDDVPNSAVDLINKDRFLKKSLRIERVAEEVKLVLKPHYNKKHVTKEEYKEILRKAVPKICHNKTGEINIQKIHALVEAYIKKIRYKRKSQHIASSI